ncbi:hypothetical protein [Scytonema sp. HK-05]|uniref:hypothetical protein n=1 Tax=Scytonema sp. HK-05 TaxID=1137095 RepID=UPI0013015501|nr:hypothetical protein [Scytonema sp. HK-05]
MPNSVRSQPLTAIRCVSGTLASLLLLARYPSGIKSDSSKIKTIDKNKNAECHH